MAFDEGLLELVRESLEPIGAVTMRRMNAAVDQHGRSPAAVAAEFLAE